MAVGNVGAGIVKPPADGAIGGRAWCDLNEDGQRQNGEPLLPDVTVTLRKLTDGRWTDFDTTTTNPKGRYQFKDLELGVYLVVFEDKGLEFTKPNIGNDKRDSDVVKDLGRAGRTGRITLTANDPTNYRTDAGYVGDCAPTLGSIGDRVWFDTDENGLQDAGEEGVEGVTVTLKDANGTVINTTTTDANGNYLFDDLEAGDYLVGFVEKAGFVFTIANAGGNDDIDSDADVDTGMTATISLGEGEEIRDVDAGLVEEAPEGVLGSIGDRVWLDKNGNGLQDADEVGVEGVRVRLSSASSGSFVAEIFTDANGNYLFENLEADDYRVLFYRPDGYFFTIANVGDNDDIDSDVVSSGGSTGITQLGEGEHRRDVDAGLVAESSPPCISAHISNFNYIFNNNGSTKDLLFHVQIDAAELGFPKINSFDWTPLTQLVDSIWGAKIRVDNYYKFVSTADYEADRNGKLEVWIRYRLDIGLFDKKWENYKWVPVVDYSIAEFNEALLDLEFDFKAGPHYNSKNKFKACVDSVAKFRWSSIKSPIALDTDGSGTVERIDGEFAFDFAANGERTKATEWFAPTEGILVDTRIPGPMTGAHLFGDMDGKYTDGYAKLATLDANADGAVSGAELQGLAIWTDANSNAKLDEGELSSLAAHQIVSLSTRHTGYVSTVTLADGTTMMSADLWFPVILPPVAAPVATPVSINALAFGLGGATVLVLLIVAIRRRQQVPVPGMV